MMDLATIEALSRRAARIAAKQKKQPFIVEQSDLNKWAAGPTRLPFPNIGSLRPKGWKKVTSLFCDSSGCGLESEPALTYSGMIRELNKWVGHGVAITSCGQFQLYLGIFEKI